MRRSYVLGFWTLVPLAYVRLTASSFAQQKSLKEQLVGTWTVVSWLETFKDGSK